MFDGKKAREAVEAERLKLEEVVKDNKELIETLQRLQAEFENFRKREEKNKTEFEKFSTAGVFTEILPIMDAFESALKKGNEEQRGAIEPLYYLLKSFLGKNSVKQFSALNELFNHEMHEAVETGYSQDKDEGIVLEEFKKGYTLNGKLLRHATVKINQKPVKKIAEIKKQLQTQLQELEKEPPKEKTVESREDSGKIEGKEAETGKKEEEKEEKKPEAEGLEKEEPYNSTENDSVEKIGE